MKILNNLDRLRFALINVVVVFEVASLRSPIPNQIHKSVHVDGVSEFKHIAHGRMVPHS